MPAVTVASTMNAHRSGSREGGSPLLALLGVPGAPGDTVDTAFLSCHGLGAGAASGGIRGPLAVSRERRRPHPRWFTCEIPASPAPARSIVPLAAARCGPGTGTLTAA